MNKTIEVCEEVLELKEAIDVFRTSRKELASVTEYDESEKSAPFVNGPIQTPDYISLNQRTEFCWERVKEIRDSLSPDAREVVNALYHKGYFNEISKF